MDNKCVHLNDSCDLQSPRAQTVVEKSINDKDKDVTNMNYITANGYFPQKHFTFEPNNCDSVLSIKNCSTILHNSNHTMYKTQSPTAMQKALERQTSTPMHQNLYVFQSPETNGCCGSCLMTSNSSQMSSIHSSSESDTSPQHATVETNKTR